MAARSILRSKIRSMTLIDSWSPAANEAYSPFEQLPPWVEPIETYATNVTGTLYVLEALRRAGEELEDRLEGVFEPTPPQQKAAA